MQILNYTRLALKKCDVFSTSQFLRYQTQAQYKTATGGICSIFVVILFIIPFINIAIQTINLQIINWSSTIKTSFIPNHVSIDTRNSKFMFAVSLVGINLNDPNQRLFDIQIRERHFKGGLQLPKNKVQMVPCTQQHFNINQQISTTYKQLSANRLLCPPLGYNFTLQGKWTTKNFRNIQVYLGKCKNSTDSRPCASDETINQYMAMTGQFIFSLIYVNPLINPASQNYLDYQLQDRNYLKFTTKLGARSIGYVQDYSIVTDVSLLPYSQNVKDNGTIIPDLFQNIAYQITGNNYASFFLMKSSSNVIYQRSFNKIDSFFSYVGGLIGIIIGFMIIIKTYTEMSFVLDLSQKIFNYKDDDSSNSQCFNIITYCMFQIYSLLSFFGLQKEWQQMIKYNKCKEEMMQQLNIQLLLNRITFLEKSMETWLKEKRFVQLDNQKLDSLDKIKKRRQKLKNKNQIIQDKNGIIIINKNSHEYKTPIHVRNYKNKDNSKYKDHMSSDKKGKNNQNVEDTINQSEHSPINILQNNTSEFDFNK